MGKEIKKQMKIHDLRHRVNNNVSITLQKMNKTVKAAQSSPGALENAKQKSLIRQRIIANKMAYEFKLFQTQAHSPSSPILRKQAKSEMPFDQYV